MEMEHQMNKPFVFNAAASRPLARKKTTACRVVINTYPVPILHVFSVLVAPLPCLVRGSTLINHLKLNLRIFFA